jgi:hypothetical protein
LATLHKRVKELKRHFPNLIKTITYKRPPKLLFNNNSLKNSMEGFLSIITSIQSH